MTAYLNLSSWGSLRFARPSLTRWTKKFVADWSSNFIIADSFDNAGDGIKMTGLLLLETDNFWLNISQGGRSGGGRGFEIDKVEELQGEGPLLSTFGVGLLQWRWWWRVDRLLWLSLALTHTSFCCLLCRDLLMPTFLWLLFRLLLDNYSIGGFSQHVEFLSNDGGTYSGKGTE